MGFCQCRFQLATGAFAALFINFLRSFDVQDNKYRIFCLWTNEKGKQFWG